MDAGGETHQDHVDIYYLARVKISVLSVHVFLSCPPPSNIYIASNDFALLEIGPGVTGVPAVVPSFLHLFLAFSDDSREPR